MQDVVLEDRYAREEQPYGTGGACTPVDEGGLELAELFGGDVAQTLEGLFRALKPRLLGKVV